MVPGVSLLDLMDDHHAWRHQLPALADAGYRAIAPDMRGFGGTDPPPWSTGDRLRGERLSEVADAIGLASSSWDLEGRGIVTGWGTGDAQDPEEAVLGPPRPASGPRGARSFTSDKEHSVK